MANGIGFIRFQADVIYRQKISKLKSLEKKASLEEKEILRYLQNVPQKVFDQIVQLFLEIQSGSIIDGVVIPTSWQSGVLYRELQLLQQNRGIAGIKKLESFINKVEKSLSEEYVDDQSISREQYYKEKFNKIRQQLDDLGIDFDDYPCRIAMDWIRYELVRLFRLFSDNESLNIHIYKKDFAEITEEFDELNKWIADDFLFRLALPTLKKIADELKTDITSDLIFNAPLDKVLMEEVLCKLKQYQVPYKKNFIDETSYFKDISRGYGETEENYADRIHQSNIVSVETIKILLDARLKNLGAKDHLPHFASFDSYYQKKYLKNAVTNEEDKAMSAPLIYEPLNGKVILFRRYFPPILFGVFIGTMIGLFFGPLGAAIGAGIGIGVGIGSRPVIDKSKECKIAVCDDKTNACAKKPLYNASLDRFYQSNAKLSIEFQSLRDLKPTINTESNSIGAAHRCQSISPNTPRI